MDIADGFLPGTVFAPDGPQGAPRAFISPQRYIQGAGVLAHLGRYLSLVRTRRAAVLVTAGGRKRHGAVIDASLGAAGIEHVHCEFGGECSMEEIARHTARLQDEGIDCVIAVGGGKCVDTGKAIAFRRGVPVVVVPTLASNDAPCSALSVLYLPSGVSSGVEFYPSSPALVVVDTAVVAAASERFLVAGMGDAMATWYEAAVCFHNPNGMTTLGARPTAAAVAIGEVCARTLFDKGEEAAAAVAASRVDGALEEVVEANTLLSGLGFESGGLAAAHGFAQSFTALPATHAGHLHGEMVAMGTLAQLVLEGRSGEAEKVAAFFARVGLPARLEQLSIDPADRRSIAVVAQEALGFPFLGNMPMPLDAAQLTKALLDAHELGRSVSEKIGDEAWKRLHAGR